jgi:hypothetical protein
VMKREADDESGLKELLKQVSAAAVIIIRHVCSSLYQ